MVRGSPNPAIPPVRGKIKPVAVADGNAIHMDNYRIIFRENRTFQPPKGNPNSIIRGGQHGWNLIQNGQGIFQAHLLNLGCIKD